jgi:hypothetical protein
MSTTTKLKTKTLSLRIKPDLYDYLEQEAQKNVRSVSNYLEWLIEEKRKQDNLVFQKNLSKMREIGSKVFAENGLNPDQISEEEVYDFIKKI